MFIHLQNKRSISGLSRLARLPLRFYNPSGDTAVKSTKLVGYLVNTYEPHSFLAIRVFV